MEIKTDKALAPLTSFKTGGKAKKYVLVDKVDELIDALISKKFKPPLWVLGSGTNVLISDAGLPGTVLHLDNKKIKQANEVTLIADAGVSWDDLVKYAIKKELWGMELTSGTPGNVGAAVAANIAAYGHAVSDSLIWAESIDLTHPELGVVKSHPEEIMARYHTSAFQEGSLKNHLVLRAAFRLSKSKTKDLNYHSALLVADELGLDVDTLSERRKVIMEVRKRAGSLYDPKSKNAVKSCGSYFRNPTVSLEKAEEVMSYDEGHVSKDILKAMNKAHSGDATRVSAAHVLLAAGFSRGQSWGKVRLMPSHVLKIENTGGATSQEIYNVSQEIINAVKDKLDIDLRPEVRFLGKFGGRMEGAQVGRDIHR